MKIFLERDGELEPLRHHLELEGQEVISLVGPTDLVLYEPSALPTVLLNLEIEDGPITHFVTRWFDKGFHEQTFVGVPLLKFNNDDLGPEVCAGMAGRFVAPHLFDYCFNHEALTKYLEDSSHVGFVSLKLSGSRVIGLQTGVPYYGLFGLLEGCKGSVGEWLKSPTRLFESWRVSLLVSRFPYPHLQKASRGTVSGITPELEEHLWTFGGERFKQNLLTTATRVGVVTAEGRELSWTGHSALERARGLVGEGLQFRTDIVESVKGRWLELKSGALV